MDFFAQISNFVKQCKRLKENPKAIGSTLSNAMAKSSFFWGTQQNDIGVSVGHSNIIAVEVDKTQSVPSIVRFAVRKINDINVNIAETLSDIFQKERLSNRFINTSLSGKSIIVRFIKFPRMNKKDLRSALEYESEKYIPFSASDVYLDFDIVQSNDKQKFIQVALVAAKKDVVQEILTECKNANLTVKVLDVDSFACLNTFLAAYPSEKVKTTALINIGAKLTNLLIVAEGIPAFSRDIYFGGDDIAHGLSKKLGVDIAEASRLQYNLKNARDERVKMIVQERLNYLIAEIKLSFDYFENQLEREKGRVEAAYLTGGTSQLEGLTELFEETLHIKTVLLDPLRCVTVDDSINKELLNQYAPSLAVPIGLAIRQ